MRLHPAIQRAAGARGFSVLAFPCNQFGHQEPGTDAQIQGFCETNYHTTFPLFAKVDVNGAHAHPLFAYLKERKGGGLLGSAIKWNFTKFLVGRDGTVLDRFPPTTAPEAIAPRIEAALGVQ
jgi:glutathione peroxidase